MDAIKLLKHDHKTVKGLFRQFEQATRRAEKQKLGEEIIEELSIHAILEEQLLYPTLRAKDARLTDDVLESLEEHHAVKLTLAELDKLKVDHERYDAKMHVVRESVEMHIEKEEAELLPRLERLLDAEEREQLGDVMLALKQAAPNHPHPLSPDYPPEGLVAGMFAKVTDLGKDLVRKVTNADKAEGHRRVRRRAKATRKRTAA